MADTSRTCPHCGSHLEKWRVPEDASWSEEFFFVCFNDDCSYYKEGVGVDEAAIQPTRLVPPCG